MESCLRIVLSCRSRKARGTQAERNSVPEQYITAVKRQLDKEESRVSASNRKMASEMKVKQPRRRRSTPKYVRSPPKKPLPTISESEDHRSLRSYYVQHQANGNRIVSVPADRGSFFSGEGLSFPVCLAVYDVRAAGKSGPCEDKPTDDGHAQQVRVIEEDSLAIAGEALREALDGSDDEGHSRLKADKPGGSRRTASPETDELSDLGGVLSTPVNTYRRSSQRDTGDSSPTLATPEQADHGLTRTSSSDSFVTADSDSLTEVSADGSTSSAQLSATRACPSKQAPDTRAEKAAVSECRSLCAAKSKKFTVDSARDIDFEIVSARRKQANDVSYATKPELAMAEQEPPSTPVAQQASSQFITHHNPAFSPDPQDGSAAWEYPAHRLPKSIRTLAGKSAIAEVIFGDSAREPPAACSLAFALHTGTSSQLTPQPSPETPCGSRAQLDSAYRSPFSSTFESRPQQPAPGSLPQSVAQHAQTTLDEPTGKRPTPSAQNGSASPLGFHFRLKPESPLHAQPQQNTSQLGPRSPPIAHAAEQGNDLNAALLVSQSVSLQDLVHGPHCEEQVASQSQDKVPGGNRDKPLAVARYAGDEGEPSQPPGSAPARAQGSSAAEVVLLSPTVDQLAQEIRRRQDTLEQLILFYDSWVDRLGCADLRVNPRSLQQAARSASSALTSAQPSFTSSQLALLNSRPPSVCSGGRSPRVEASDLSGSSALSELSGHPGPRSPAKGPELSSSQTVVLQGGGLFRGSVGIAGKPHGLGRYQSVGVPGDKTGDLYQGEFADGLMHGLGVYYFGGCGWYSGQWVQGRQQGYGKQIFANGTMCLGSFGRTGRLDGFGVCLYPTGDSYEGQFKDGVPHGHGYHKAASKGAYAGSFCDGRRCGIGVYRFANRDTFSGTFEGDHPSGHGVYTTRLRECLEGEFHDGQVHGWGVRILPDGAMAAGKWERGRLQWSRSLQATACYDGLPDLDAEGMDLAQETARGARHSAALAERAARAARTSTQVMDAVRLAMEAARLADTASKKGARIASK